MDNDQATSLLNEHNKEEFAPAHTAEHLLNQTMDRMFHCGRSKNAHIERKKSKINWPLAQAPTPQQIEEIEHTIQDLIAQDLPVTYEFVTKDAVPADVPLDKLPDNASETLRLVRIGDYDVCACIGTHVKSTKEIGSFRISSTSYSDGVFRIVYRVSERIDVPEDKPTKSGLRKSIKDKISEMKASDKENESLFVCLQIIGTAEWQQAETVLLYEAMPDEVDLSLLLQDARDSGKQVLMPQPSADAPALPVDLLEKVDLAIIPGRAFTAQGTRMGRGKGYYDRLLPSLHCPKWGVAFGCQMVKEIPTDTWDQPLDKVFWN